MRMTWLTSKDARNAQITALGSLLLLGLAWFGFPIGGRHILSCLGGAIGAQFIACCLLKIPFDWKSPLISALSLSLLLRAGEPWLAVLAGALAIGSKFIIRWRGKHVFNPANFGLVLTAWIFSGAWISPGQWGSGMLVLIGFAVAGLIVSGRAGRWDVALAFLGFYALILLGRAFQLGDPIAIPLHQLQSGALLLFAFFMISDPKTTPDSRPARLIFAAMVAATGTTLLFKFYRPLGVIEALLVCAPLVPFLDRLLPGAQYRWSKDP